MSTELVVQTSPSGLRNLDPLDREVAVTRYLTDARDRLALAVDATGPEAVAALKAEIATMAEATKQLGLSKEIRDDATEMVRRAEYALGKAIRKGQAEGTVLNRNEPGSYANQTGPLHNQVLKSKVTDFAGHSELNGNGREPNGIYHLTDGVSNEKFESALADAKAEGNVSRANVVRKITGQSEASGLTRQQRADIISDLAEQGFTSRQMPPRVGVTDATVREIARAFSIEIPADKIVGPRSRRINYTEAVNSTVTDLENSAEFITSFIDLDKVDLTGADEWVSSLTNSIRTLTRFRNQLKEKTHA